MSPTHQELREMLVELIRQVDVIADRLIARERQADELVLRLEELVRVAPEILAEYGSGLEHRRTQEHIEKRLRAMDKTAALRRRKTA